MSKLRPGVILRVAFPVGAAGVWLFLWLIGPPRGFGIAREAISPGRVEKASQAAPGALFAAPVFINEIHYDNNGADTGEGIEIAGPAGTNLSGWQLVLYNGNGDMPYATISLNGLFPDQGYGYGCAFFPFAGLQNGAPDGIALVNAFGTLIQYLSYEGMMGAVGGPARGSLSLDIGVEETGDDAEGYSLQLGGQGNAYPDFTWASPAPATPGAPNAGQVFLPPSSPGDLRIGKSAPAYVAAGEQFTYTLMVYNFLGKPLHHLEIRDAVPAGASFAAALDGGQYENGVVLWEANLLEDGAGLEVRFAVTAPPVTPTLLVNDSYTVSAEEWFTPTWGEARYTMVGEYTPLPVIQGGGSRSPLAGAPVRTRGVVTGFFQGNYPEGNSFNGFFLQDQAGDGDPGTSDGIFIHSGTSNLPVSAGDLIEVTGMVQEFDEWDGPACPGEACLTQIRVSSSANVRFLGLSGVTPSLLDPPGDPQLAVVYFESVEGMLVHLPITATVAGPTSFGTISILPGDEGLQRVLRSSPQEGMTFGVRHWERSGDIGGANAPGLITGSLVDGVRGPLAWSYGDYLVITQAGAPWRVVASQPLPGSLPAWPAPGPDQFSAATFNTQNLEGWGVQFTKVISTLLQMNGPTFLALQEVNPYSVFPDLVERLEAAGYSYEYAYSHADAGGHGVALLWRSEAVQEVHWSTGYQACSPVGSPSSTYDPLWETCRSRGEYPLFARRPVVITGTLSIAGSRYPVIVIANHFKSRMEGESVEQRRLEEARFVSGLAGDLAGSGSPILIVMGDLNDFEDSPPLQALYAGGTLTTTWTTIPGENRFSYNYLGVSQVLDHILVSPDLLAWLEAAAPLHLNADFPYSPYARDGHLLWRSSDHDPVAALFTVHFVNRIYLPYLSFSR